VDASWVAAIASVASALVVGIAAIAAVRQIRHIRNANEITVYLRLIERLESPRGMAAFSALGPFLERLAVDPSLRERLGQPAPLPELEEIVALVRFLDNLTMLILTRGVTERLILNEYADDIARLWDNVGELVYLRRRFLGRRFGAAFEHLAMRSRGYLISGEMDRFYARLLRDPRFESSARPP
jgi:hypothetical protein